MFPGPAYPLGSGSPFRRLRRCSRGTCSGKNKPLDGFSDGSGGQGGGGGDHVSFLGFTATAEKLLREFLAKLLTSGSLRWLLPEEWITQHFFKYWLNSFTGARDLTIAVVRSVKQALHELVHQHVARPGIKGNHLTGRS